MLRWRGWDPEGLEGTSVLLSSVLPLCCSSDLYSLGMCRSCRRRRLPDLFSERRGASPVLLGGDLHSPKWVRQATVGTICSCSCKLVFIILSSTSHWDSLQTSDLCSALVFFFFPYGIAQNFSKGLGPITALPVRLWSVKLSIHNHLKAGDHWGRPSESPGQILPPASTV